MWLAVPQIVFLLELLYVRVSFSGPTIVSAAYSNIFFPGRDYDYQTLNLTFSVNLIKFGLIISMFPKPLKPCVVPSICAKTHLTDAHFSIVSRMISNLPSQIGQEVEFIRPIVEERFKKMEEYGESWDDKPVCQTIVSVISLITRAIYRMIC